MFGLTATPAFGGIQLKWNLPGINPQAIAYVTIFRGYLPEFEHAIKLIEWSGSGYFDQTGPGEPLSIKYYWIQVMSVNGTLGEVIGPASATARPTITQFIELLTGQIDNGVLAQSLKDKIERITGLETSLGEEVQDRLSGDVSLQEAISSLTTLVGETRTLVVDEITERVTEQGAIVEALTQLGSSTDGTLALIEQQLTVETTPLGGLAQSVETLVTRANDNEAAIIHEAEVRTSAIESSAMDLSQLMVSYRDQALGAIESESLVRVSAEGLLGSRIDALSAEWGGDIEAAIAAYNAVEVAPFKASAITSTQVETAIGSSVAQAKVDLRSEISTVDGKVTSIGARWTAQVNVDGLIGGFGVYNNGQTVEAGFDVDTFWVGRTANKVKPFIVSGTEVFIKKAVIGTVTADMLDTRGLIVRDGSGNATFEIGATGDVVLAGTLRNGQTAWDTGTGFWMGKDGGVPKMSFGSSTKGFTWDGSTFTVRGDVIASGNLQLGAVNSVLAGKVLTPVVLTGPYYGAPEEGPGATTYGNAVELPPVSIPTNSGVLLSFIWDYQQWGGSGSRVFIRVTRWMGGVKTVIYTIRTATTGTGTLGAQYPIGGQVADMGASGSCIYCIEVMQMDYMDRVQVNYAELTATIFKRVS